jgi:hypothetical protein
MIIIRESASSLYVGRGIPIVRGKGMCVYEETRRQLRVC